MCAAGMDVCRLNSSHRQPGFFEKLVPTIRLASERAGRPLQILADLQGPKFRTSEVCEVDVTLNLLGGAMELVEGQEVEFALQRTQEDLTGSVHGRITLVRTPEHEALLAALHEGARVLLDDGTLQLSVSSRLDPASVRCVVEVGGKLLSRKGVNVPGLSLACGAMTAKDSADVKSLVALGVDAFALSFVQQPRDLHQLRDEVAQYLPAHQRVPSLIAKVETRAAVDNIQHILPACDGLMVARGDLGIEIGLHKVPLVQKRLIGAAQEQGKLSITATQMLHSMTLAPVPTRAEVSDVANAVLDGTDMVMLSGESASGKFPVECVQMMRKICDEADAHLASTHWQASSSL